MALITIKDLQQSDDLDQQAMRSIAGGGRTAVLPALIDQARTGGGPLVDYPPGFNRQVPVQAKP